MQELHIQGAYDTPEVTFDVVKGLLEIKGRSMPENAVHFYKPILNWVEEAVKLPCEEIKVNFILKYFNTSSSKMILELLRALERLSQKGKKIVVFWHYLNIDEEMKEDGEYFDELIDLPFNYIEMEQLIV